MSSIKGKCTHTTDNVQDRSAAQLILPCFSFSAFPKSVDWISGIDFSSSFQTDRKRDWNSDRVIGAAIRREYLLRS